MKISGVILAAGRSRRMGRPKQLLRYRGRTFLQHALDCAREADLDRLILVLGHEADAILEKTDVRGVEVVVNRDYGLGQSTSVIRGLDAAGACDGVLFQLGDQPLVESDTLNRIIGCFRKEGPGAVVPVYQGTRGNPALLGTCFFHQIRTLRGDTGPRRILRDDPDRVRLLPVEDEGIVRDIDTPEEWARLRVESGEGTVTVSSSRPACPE